MVDGFEVGLLGFEVFGREGLVEGGRGWEGAADGYWWRFFGHPVVLL